jgi:hypothetical protein
MVMAILGKHIASFDSVVGTVTTTVPGGRRWYLSNITVHCVAADTITVTVNLAAAVPQIVFYAALDLGDTAYIDANFVLNEGDQILVLATTTTSDVSIFGGVENV